MDMLFITDPTLANYFTTEELCNVTEVSSHSIIEIVEHGIVEPEGTDPENWVLILK